ncbi:MAG: sulfur carrier protein ThiS [Hyphomicrobiaceae bacterium]|nr:sulfur carrier protein ThiS [Hyphomicrobiaceae bacterium]
MKIVVNGEATQTQAKTLEELCAALGHGTAKVATALNGDFVPAPQRGQIKLTENDAVEIVSPRQGG